MVIAVDFDGTCVTHEYPKIGKDIGAIPVLRALTDKGHKLILWTMRSGKEEKEAELWFRDNNIPLWSIGFNPEQKSWTNSNKAYAQLYIDDAALGCPLKYNTHISVRPFVCWESILQELVHKGIL